MMSFMLDCLHRKLSAMVSLLTATLSLVVTFVILISVQAAMAQDNQSEVSAILKGEALAKTNCSRCHAVGLEGESPNANAPTFRNFSSYREIGLIHMLLLEKTTPKHTDMPHFAITVKQTADILAWINWVQPVPHGKRLAVKNCSQCHAVDIYDESANPSAPPFRNLSIYYPVHSLEEAFAEGIDTGHPGMPVFDVTINQLRDMVEYIQTLQNPVLD